MCSCIQFNIHVHDTFYLFQELFILVFSYEYVICALQFLLPCTCPSVSYPAQHLLSFFLSSLFLSTLFFKLIRRMECRTVLYYIIVYRVVLYYIVLQSIVLYKIGSRLSAVISLFPLLPPSLQLLLSLFFYPHSNPHQINYIQLYST